MHRGMGVMTACWLRGNIERQEARWQTCSENMMSSQTGCLDIYAMTIKTCWSRNWSRDMS